MYSFPAQTHFGSYGFPAAYPTTFAQAAPAASSASAHEGSQAGDHQASHSVSGFAGQPIDAGFGGFYGAPQATFIGGAPFYGGEQYGQQFGHQFGQATILPGAAAYPGTFLPQQALVPIAAPTIRRPGYNERLVAWRNRQKAFNRYKRQTKEAIKSANHHHYASQNTLLAQSTVYGAAPVFGGAPTVYGGAPYGASYGQTFIGAPAYGQTFIGAPAYGQFLPYAGEVQHADGHQENYNNDFTSYSSAGQVEAAQEEPEIRGTQV